jgi:CO/xanthine dehydrogenase FAD-binding subunit
VAVVLPKSLDEAVDALAQHPDAHVLAGGTDLMVEVNMGHRRPVAVVALGRVDELRGWQRMEDGRIRLGARLTYTEMLEPDLAALLPALAEAARTVGSPQIRNAGTIGGNLGTASPAGDGLPVLSALDAEIEVAGPGGRRRLSVHDFFRGVKRTALEPGELVVAATVPVLDGWQGFAKVGVRNAMVIAIASACLAVDRSGRSVRIALGAVGPTVLRARAAEAWLESALDWEAMTAPPGVVEELGRRVTDEARPIDDHRSTAAYRRHAVGVLTRRLLQRATAAAEPA